MKLLVKKLREDASLPFYATVGASGLDLFCVDDVVVIRPLERALVSTGIAIELPEGYEAQIRPRSGLALKKGVTVLNSPGTIDHDYRGEIKVILINLSDKEVVIEKGERIAQMVIAPVLKVEVVEVKELSNTQRQDGGFGSTGMK
ncbi:MAG: dUTP diphosphatase [Hydrogenobaculum sp.]